MNASLLVDPSLQALAQCAAASALETEARAIATELLRQPDANQQLRAAVAAELQKLTVPSVSQSPS